ncbi:MULTISPECIES: hypothetical protein [unclassified Rhodanobacter]|jgi:hypothetical protein|uniref:Uncharacterized protein n=1 Tax=Rhodanobacter humi TaxID=1888173 RepID=A0ABV4AMM0_9GAMM
MMLPSNHSTASPVPAGMPVPAQAELATGGADENLPLHADYNLHPLKVDGLGHYLPSSEEPEEERFHVR